MSYSLDQRILELHQENMLLLGFAGENNSENFREYTIEINKRLKSNQPIEMNQEFLNEELSCNRRIIFKEKFYCVYKPPQKKLLETVEICKACLKIKRNIPAITVTQRPQIPTTAKTLEEQISEWKPVEGYEKQLNLMRADGARYCPFRDVYQYTNHCRECKEVFRGRYEACIRLHNQHNLSKSFPSHQKGNV